MFEQINSCIVTIIFSLHLEDFIILIIHFGVLKIVNAVNEGKLVPEEIIFGILSKRLEDGYQRGDSGFILDGIPRTRTQAVSQSCFGLTFPQFFV